MVFTTIVTLLAIVGLSELRGSRLVSKYRDVLEKDL
jgi:hypothetical protein